MICSSLLASFVVEQMTCSELTSFILQGGHSSSSLEVCCICHTYDYTVLLNYHISYWITKRETSSVTAVLCCYSHANK